MGGKPPHIPRYQQPTNELIMVVDDDEVMRHTAAVYLEQSGYRTLLAEGGQQAIELYDKAIEKPALALIEVAMSGLTGYETCWELRKRIKDIHLPILMATRRDDPGSVDLAFQAGATDFVTKPINWILLVQRVRYALRSRDIYLDLERKQGLLSHAQRIAKLGYGQMNLTRGIVELSPEIEEILGVERGAIQYVDEFVALLKEDDREPMMQAVKLAVEDRSSYRFEHSIRLSNKKEKVILQRGEVVEEGKEILIIGTLQDITEQAEAEQTIHYFTYYDPLTNLANRKLFELQLEERLKCDDLQAVLFVGLDRFKSINDSLGHSGGDELLKVIAQRFNKLQKGGMLVARFSGGTFAFYVPKVKSVEQVDDLAQELLEMIRLPMIVCDHELEMSASIGIALVPLEAKGVERALLGADTALNMAKQSGGAQYRYFSSEMDVKAQERLKLEQGLREALKERQFELYYQPQVDARSQEIVGVEALIRWNHKENGVISPGMFIPLAEETGLIIPIGEWVLRSACFQAKQWLDMGIKLRIGVNLSAKQLQLVNLQSLVASVLEESGLPPQQLDLEITESMAIGDYDNTIEVLKSIHELKVLTSMDDFGTGYSSLSYLHKLPLNTLKIDRAFIKDINEQGEHGEIAMTIITLAHSLGLHVIAEGIETRAQYEHLLMNGCDEIQGFYFSKPLSASDFEQLYKDKNGKLYVNEL